MLRRGLFVSELERAPRPAPPAAANVVRFSAGATASSVQNNSTKTDAAAVLLPPMSSINRLLILILRY
jgi:hypothetical protein